MLSEKTVTAAHAGEAQASDKLDPREDYWAEVEAEMLKLPAVAKLYSAAVPALTGGAA